MGSAPSVDSLEKPDKEVKNIGEKRIENNPEDSCDHTPKFRRFKSSCQIQWGPTLKTYNPMGSGFVLMMKSGLHFAQEHLFTVKPDPIVFAIFLFFEPR